MVSPFKEPKPLSSSIDILPSKFQKALLNKIEQGTEIRQLRIVLASFILEQRGTFCANRSWRAARLAMMTTALSTAN
jgi:hypothetical protein